MSEQDEVKVVGALPPRGNINTEWDGFVPIARENPGQAVRVGTNVPNLRVNAIRQYVRRPPYLTEEGRIEVSLRNSRVDADNIRRGEMYFTWHPATKKKR